MKIVLILIILMAASAYSQDEQELNLFGSMQSIYMQEEMNLHMNNPLDTTLYEGSSGGFLLQQLDLFLSRNFDNKFNMFIDFELKLNFSTERNWGELNLQEAWVDYQHSDWLNIKAGLLFPKFNNLNEIKNKLPILPYLMRPVVYEQMLSKRFDLEDYVPDRAFVQIFGFIPFSNVRCEYAFYVGNSENSYIIKNNSPDSINSNFISGLDTKGWNFKLFGGRLGVRKDDETFKAGISFTYDRENYNMSFVDYIGKYRIIYGDIPRTRIGFDLSFKIWGFEFESEMINVIYSDYPKDKPSDRLNHRFFYGLLLFNIFDNIFAYSSFEYKEDRRYYYEKSTDYCVGGGWRISNSIVAKTQYIRYIGDTSREIDNISVAANVNIFLIGLSVLF